MGGAECQLGCSFCFAKRSDYIDQKFPDLNSSFTRIGAVLYPVCDSEAQFNTESLGALENFVDATSEPLIVSLSTKSKMSSRVRDQLARLNRKLMIGGRGFVKLAASVSTFQTSDRLEYEHGCASAVDRRATLSAAAEQGISTSLTLKPVLPQVPVDDYLKLIELFSTVTKRVLLGGLYCDPSTSFGKNTLNEYSHLVSRRRVNWLPGKPEWLYVEDPITTAEIRRHAESLGCSVFDSDIQLVMDIRKTSLGVRPEPHFAAAE